VPSKAVRPIKKPRAWEIISPPHYSPRHPRACPGDPCNGKCRPLTTLPSFQRRLEFIARVVRGETVVMDPSLRWGDDKRKGKRRRKPPSKRSEASTTARRPVRPPPRSGVRQNTRVSDINKEQFRLGERREARMQIARRAPKV